jgi:hypothetical protein
LPTRLTKIDELTRPDHTFLAPDDECYYLGEYTARKGFAFSDMNNLVNNLRKPMERRGRPEWRYKESAITTCGNMFREALNDEWLDTATLVSVPSSMVQTDPNYDDRLPRILRQVSHGRQFDIRELVIMTRTVPQSHLAPERVSIEELIESMSINEACVRPAPQSIGIFDDVLTTGRHFKAVQTIIQQRFPSVPVVGLFVARRVPDSTLPEGFL